MIDPQKPFWRETPLTGEEQNLLALLFDAHATSAERENISTMTAVHTAAGSGDYSKAIAAALLTLGGAHAPVADVCHLLSFDDPSKEVDRLMVADIKVPGFGNSFVKSGRDLIWDKVHNTLRVMNPEIYKKIDDMTGNFIQCWDLMIFPNPAMYTAAVALTLGISPAMAPSLFLFGRLNTWTRLIAQQLS